MGMEVGRSKTGFYILQSKHILDLLEETGELGWKSANIPLRPNWKTKDIGTDQEVERDECECLADSPVLYTT